MPSIRLNTSAKPVSASTMSVFVLEHDAISTPSCRISAFGTRGYAFLTKVQGPTISHSVLFKPSCSKRAAKLVFAATLDWAFSRALK